MTEAECYVLIERLTWELAELNYEDTTFEILVSAAPFEERDEDGQPTGAFFVAVGWHCWTRTSKTAIPLEYGRSLSVTSIYAEADVLYSMLIRNYQVTTGEKRTFRTHTAARSASFT